MGATSGRVRAFTAEGVDRARRPHAPFGPGSPERAPGPVRLLSAHRLGLIGFRLGGRLPAAGNGDRGFTAFALAGVSSTVFTGIAELRSARRRERAGTEQRLIAAG
ncbi:hypothetical protein [Streptomyces sp. NPDC093248]|uniref:hypothetical protein n=1 Tax=Streptomyces sp. NPDC093248 TaxID=3155072 RepID=UPI0034211130